MSQSCAPRPRTRVSGARIEGGPHQPGRPGVADWLCLAATPTFAIMALATRLSSGGPLEALCSAAQAGSPLCGMVPMYLLMSAFHSAPWLKLIVRRRTACEIGEAPGKE
jgi:hypothetical protein